jgi:putative ABC transport system permease protein
MSILSDLRYSLRAIARSRGWAATVAATLAVGIGGSVAVFSLLNGMMLRPLPFPEESRLVFLNEAWPAERYPRMKLSYPDLVDWRERQHTFSAMAVYRPDRFTLTGTGEPERLLGATVDARFFDVLSVAPLEGRTFRSEEDRPGAERVVVIGETLWRRRFGRDPEILGRAIPIESEPHVIIGVMPDSFDFPEHAELWLPARLSPEEERGIHWLDGVGRLAPGVSLADARLDLENVAAGLARERPETHEGVSAYLRPLREEIVGDFRRPFLLLMGAVVLVLLIGCANVGNLMLSRLGARDEELAVRSALGASRGKVVRLLAAEALLLTTVGASAGLVLGLLAKQLFLAAVPVEIPRWMTYGWDARVALFTLLAAAVSGATFSLAPILEAVRGRKRELGRGSRRSTAGRRRVRAQAVLVAAEAALALVLLVGAGLVTKGFFRLEAVDPGFRADHVLVGRVELPEASYRDEASRRRFAETALRDLAALPGVDNAALASNLPLAGSANVWWFTVEGAPPPAPGKTPIANTLIVSPDYFRVMAIPLVEGRSFDESDGPDSPRVAIVNETMARRYWPRGEAVGRRVKFGLPGDEDEVEEEEPWTLVVGVTGDVRHYGLDRDVIPGVYVPEAQTPIRSLWVLTRAAGSAEAQAGPIREAIRRIDGNLPVTDTMSLEEVVERSCWTSRLYSWLFLVAGAVASFLAAIGLYGVLSHAATLRAREIGIRVALGARRADVIGLLLGQGMRSTAIGIAIGLGCAYLVTPWMASLVFDVSASDPAIFTGAAALLAIVALVASLIPARRASRADPAVVLRAE